MHHNSKILIHGPNWIGDQVMAFPFYSALRDCYPTASLTLLCAEASASLPFPPVFDDVWALSKVERRFPSGILFAAQEIRRENYDMGVTLNSSISSAYLLFASKIKTRVGFSQDGSGVFLTSSLPWLGRKGGKHKSELYLDLLEWMTAKTVTPQTLAEVIKLHREDLIVVAPGASIPLREWPYFPELLRELCAQYPDHRIVVVGSDSEAKWHSVIKRLAISRIEDWIGKTTLTQLRDLFSKARVVVANDSGLAHVAATLSNTPTVVLFGPGDPDYISPSGTQVERVRLSELPCSPCESRRCGAPYGYQRCLKDLGVERVLTAIGRSLSL